MRRNHDPVLGLDRASGGSVCRRNRQHRRKCHSGNKGPLPPRAGGKGISFLGLKLFNRLVEPLIVESAFERGELVAEFFIMRRRHARIEGFAVAPYLY